MTELKIGRSKDCDIILADPTVSRVHAFLVIDGGRYSIRDNQSANGTYINGKRVMGTAPLGENDIVKVGTSVVPWKKYIPVKKDTPPPVIPTVHALPVEKKKKKGISAALIASTSIVVVLAVLIVYFFIISEKDELRISDTWVCDKNCGSLYRITFGPAKNKTGVYTCTASNGSTGPVGTYAINTGASLLELRPGILTATDSLFGLTKTQETYKYDMSRNNLSLIPWENGVRSGGQITLVKLR